MRKLSFVVVYMLVQLNVFAQSEELEVGYDLAQEMLQWELNPTHKAESDRYLKSMNYAFGFNGPDIEEVYPMLSDVDGAIPTMIEDSYDGRMKTWRATSIFVSLALYSEGEKRMFYFDMANHIARTDSDQTYAAVLLLEYIESIGSGGVEKRRSVLLAYVQAYEEEIGIEFAERIYAFLEEK